ncbi:hypothetical protein [Psychromonas sp. KJ10-2]|uniref:hypothetical protein n=1 Tax=Psychromonas sp. KJ10-2 TaxID=3391822 RepID=UPI0039B36C2D
MNIKDRIIANASVWLAMAEKGEITYKEVYLMVNAFELGISELAEVIENPSLGSEAYQQISIVNLHIRNKSGCSFSIPTTDDEQAIDHEEIKIRSAINFTSHNVDIFSGT